MLIESRSQFEAARTILLDADIIAVDLETSGFYVHQGDFMAGISTFCELKEMPGYGAGFYFPFRHKPGTDLFSSSENLPEEWLRELIPILSSSDKTFVFHNAKFDMRFLRSEGIEIRGTIYDTLIEAHILNENEPHGLKELGKKYVDKNAKDEQEAIKRYVKKAGSFDQVPARIIEPYAVKDAELTHKLHETFLPKIQQEGLMEVLTTRMSFMRCLFEVEWDGVAVDLELAKQLADEATQQMRSIEDQIGFDPLKLDRLAHKLFGAPPDGLGLRPLALTNTSSEHFPNGRPVMDEATLSTYSEPLVKLVLDYRGLVKANSTWYTGFQQKAQRDGRIHPTFNQTGTVTGRLSCSDPNLQQLPRNVDDTPVRRMMTAPERYQLWEFDYAQIEFRLSAVYAECQPLFDIFRSGQDIFTTMARDVNVDRQTMKMVVYLTLYGGGAANLAQRLGISVDDAKQILLNFHDRFPGYREIAKRTENLARQRGWVQTWAHRRRHLSVGWCKKHERVDDCQFHKAFNAIIQGGAGNIVEFTMLKFHEQRTKKPYKMVCQVHDALWFEIPDDFREEYIEEIRGIMEWPIQKFDIPFPVDAKRIK